MAGGKTLPGTDGVLPDDVAAAIDEKQRTEQHWRRAGSILPEESDPPLGAREPAPPADRPPSPGE